MSIAQILHIGWILLDELSKDDPPLEEMFLAVGGNHEEDEDDLCFLIGFVVLEIDLYLREDVVDGFEFVPDAEQSIFEFEFIVFWRFFHWSGIEPLSIVVVLNEFVLWEDSP